MTIATPNRRPHRWLPFGPTVLAVAFLLAPAVAAGSSPSASGSLTLSVAGASPNAIGLSWTLSGGSALFFVNYEVDRSTNGSNGPWSTVATITDFLASSFYWDGLTPGVSYWWRVVENQSGVSPTTSNVVLQSQPGTAGLTVGLAGPTAMSLSWTNGASYGSEVGFVSYTVAESVDNGSFTNVSVINAESNRAVSVSGLHPGSSYQFVVHTADQCQGASNCGAFPGPSVSDSNIARKGTPSALTATVTSAPTSLAQGAPGAFACLATGGASPRLYNWNFGDGKTAAGRNVTHSFAQSGTFTVACQVHDSLGTRSNATTSVVVASNGSAPGNGTGTPPSTGSGGNGGGTPGPVASTSAPFGPVVTGLLAVAIVAAIVWLAILVSRRRSGVPKRAPPPPPGPPPWVGEASTSESPAGSPANPSGGAGASGPRRRPSARDFDALMEELDGVPSARR